MEVGFLLIVFLQIESFLLIVFSYKSLCVSRGGFSVAGRPSPLHPDCSANVFPSHVIPILPNTQIVE